MKVYVMRHGRTVWNEKGRVQGWSKNRLSKSGKEGVELQAEKYKNVKFDLIFSSPLMRTMQTANIMNKFHNVPIIKDERLIEINKGTFAGRWKKTISPEEQNLRFENPHAVGMESFDEVFERLKNFVSDFKEKFNGGDFLIITHSKVTDILVSLFEEKTCEHDFRKLAGFKNAEISMIKF